MTSETREWLATLRDFAAEWRRDHPVPEPPPAEAAAEGAILAAHVATWLDGIDAPDAARETLAAARPGLDPRPALVITTSPVGIAAAERVISGHPRSADVGPRLAVVTEIEYRRHCMRHADDRHRLHVNHWNWIKTRVPPQRAAEFVRHRLGEGEAWWLHRTGTAGAGEADRRDCHLWRWNGRHAALVEPFIREGRVSHFAADGPAAGDD